MGPLLGGWKVWVLCLRFLIFYNSLVNKIKHTYFCGVSVEWGLWVACPPSIIPHHSSGSGGNCSQVLWGFFVCLFVCLFFPQEKWFWMTRFSGRPRLSSSLYSFFLLHFHLDVVHLPGFLSCGPTSCSTSEIPTSSPGCSFSIWVIGSIAG